MLRLPTSISRVFLEVKTGFLETSTMHIRAKADWPQWTDFRRGEGVEADPGVPELAHTYTHAIVQDGKFAF